MHFTVLAFPLLQYICCIFTFTFYIFISLPFYFLLLETSGWCAASLFIFCIFTFPFLDFYFVFQRSLHFSNLPFHLLTYIFTFYFFSSSIFTFLLSTFGDVWLVVCCFSGMTFTFLSSPFNIYFYLSTFGDVWVALLLRHDFYVFIFYIFRFLPLEKSGWCAASPA